MFIEILFSIIFFVLPLAGMFITILTTKIKEENTKSAKGTKRSKELFSKRQSHIQYFDDHYFFKKKRGYEAPERWILDSS